MKNVMTAGAALLLTTSIASAGGLDRSGQGVGVLWEEGNVIQLSFGSISPSVTGETTFPTPVPNTQIILPPGLSSGNMAESYIQLGGGIKYGLNENIDLALIFDQPFGADVSYADADPGYYTGAATATVDSSAITALARYKLDENISFHGGLRMQTVQASVSKPTAAAYTIDSEASTAYGFVVGAAYEIPAIALRVAVTYNSKITHDITATETCSAPIDECAAGPQTTSVDTPESYNIDFQTGVAEDTLVFGSIRYAKWTQFDFAPPAHAAIGQGSLQSYDQDTVAYSLGVGRRFSDVFSGAVSFGYEAAQGGFSGDLAPTDGNFSVGLGGTYTMGDSKITGGIRYIMLGDAMTENPVVDDADGSSFTGNSAIAFGLSVTQSF